MAPQEMQNERFLRSRDVETLVGLCATKIYYLVRDGEFPKPIKIDGAKRWRLTEVNRWMDEKIAASEAA